jgi:site-specific DNA-methyltransferase (adenine-specific)
MEVNKILVGCSKEKLKELPDNSIDSIVTDPPYELGFMGKAWDNTGIAYDVELWKECLRVLKHGGHLLAFSGTRTYHRMAVAIEDAGFEVRDMIEWIYGSGFPKSLNIGKKVDEIQGNEREVLGEKVRGDVQKAKESGSGYLADPANRNNEKQFGYGTETITKGNSDWEGWGTAMKPSHEPICVARKPIEKGLTIAQNCLKWGTGGINIDGSRVETNPELDDMKREVYRGERDKSTDWSKNSGFKNETNKFTGVPQEGRFPANLIHDGSEEVINCFPITKSGERKSTHSIGNEQGENHNNGIYGIYKAKSFEDIPASEGSAARFFKSILYYPKASKAERNKGCEELEEKTMGKNQSSLDGGKMLTGSGNERNNTSKNHHPTVKPVALIAYLIKLVTPKGGITLDPFGGSGTHAVACIENNFNYIIIEKELEHIPIIEARIKAATPIEENNQILPQLSLFD